MLLDVLGVGGISGKMMAVGLLLTVITGVCVTAYQAYKWQTNMLIETAVDSAGAEASRQAYEQEFQRLRDQGVKAELEIVKLNEGLDAARTWNTKFQKLDKRDWYAELQSDPYDFTTRATAGTERMRARLQTALDAGH